jgi:predicted membrane protein
MLKKGEMFMEENQKLGAGIIIITGLTLLSSVLGIFINLNIIFGKNPMFEANKFHLIIDTIFRVVFLLSTILIFMKKSLGIYLYFLTVIISIIVSIILHGFSPNVISSLILPAFMTTFVSQKKIFLTYKAFLLEKYICFF